MKFRMLLWGVAFFVTYASSSVFASKYVDLSNKSELGGPYEIGFCSRPSPSGSGQPGHAFVVFSNAGANGGRTFKAVGLQPSSLGGALASLITGTDAGFVSTEVYTSVLQNCLTVKVNKIDFERAWSAALPSFAALGIQDADVPHFENYGLGVDDCIGYIQRVGNTLKTIGLNIPDRKIGEFPRPYILRIEAVN